MQDWQATKRKRDRDVVIASFGFVSFLVASMFLAATPNIGTATADLAVSAWDWLTYYGAMAAPVVAAVAIVAGLIAVDVRLGPIVRGDD